ncbi:MAG: hypothetical protein IJU86_04935 [Firmicutes bacterium]|nr:hypothetical protein [Bacillota bacterium]
MDENKDVKNDGLLIAVGDQNINLDVLEKEYINVTNPILNKINGEINKYKDYKETGLTFIKLLENTFESFVSALRELNIKLPDKVNVQYFQGNSVEEVIKQIDDSKMTQPYKEALVKSCKSYGVSKSEYEKNETKMNYWDSFRQSVEIFKQRFICLISICKNKMYNDIHNQAKELLVNAVTTLTSNGLIFNDKIKGDINDGMIEKYSNVVSKFYEDNKSTMNEILFKAAQIKNQNEVKMILGRLEDQDKIKAEEERKKQEELKQENNEPKDKSKMEKSDNKKEKNKNEEANKKNNLDTKGKTQGNKENNKQNKSDKKSSSVQVKPNNKNKNPEIKLEQQKEIEKPNKIDKQRICEVAESSYFQSMLYTDFLNYRESSKKNTLETADTYTAFRNLSLRFANLTKKFLGEEDLGSTECFPNQEIDEFLIKYVQDDQFKQFKFRNKPVQSLNDSGYAVHKSYYEEISENASQNSDNIVKKFMSDNFIFKSQKFKKTIGETGCDTTNNDCFIWALLSHISSEKLEDIKKFVNENRKCSVPVWSDNLEISKNESGAVIRETKDLFSLAGGTEWFIDDQTKTIAYVRAALAIKIAQNQADKLENQENWEEFLTLLGCGPEKDANGNIINWAKRDVNGQSNMVGQAVADLTNRPFLLIYEGISSGYLLKTTTQVLDDDDTKTEFGLQLGAFNFPDIYSQYNNNSNMPSESFEKAKKELSNVNKNILSLINDENVISVKLYAGGNIQTRSTSGHFYAIGRNYTGEILTKQKNNDVFNRLKVEENFKSNSDKFIRNLNQLGFTEKNKNMPSHYFLANASNIQGLKDIIDFLRRLDPKNIKANFDKWFKDLLCSADGKIDENDENNFKDQIIRLFYSRDKDNKLYKDGNKVLGWHEVIKNFSSRVPSQFHFKWFQIVYQLLTDPISFYKNTVIGKLANIKLENDNGMKYFGYLIGKFVEAVKDQKTYDAWKKKFIDGDYLENILTRKNDIENDFSSEVKDKKFIGYDNQNIVDDLFKFIKLFDPSDLYVLIGVVKKEQNCDALKPLYNLSPKTVSKFFTLFREFVAKGKNQNEIKNDENSNDNDIKEQDNIENAHINLIKLLGEINSQNPNGIFDQIISDSKSFGELRDSLKTINSIVDQGDGAKDFLFALDFESFKKALSDFKQEKEKKEHNKEEEKKENNQQSFWDFIKDKNYERDDIQKIVSVSNSLDEIKNNLEELNNDELPMYLCKKYHEVENKKNIFWKLYIGIKSNISKIFSLFQKNDKNNINIKENIDDEQSLESIASALNKDGDEGENARIMFYSMSKNMGLKEKGKLWEKISSYMKEKEEENKKPERKKYEEEISTKTK